MFTKRSLGLSALRTARAHFQACYLSYAALTAMTLCVVDESHAQTMSNESVNDHSGVLTEVIVTARKREESLLDVPASVTLFSPDQLQDLRIQSFIDYADKVPNLSFSYGTGQSGINYSRTIAIRGIGGANTTALYLDDTPINQAVDPRVVDIERIEVLKGPQGSLFGADSMGGAIRLVTRRPDTTRNSYEVKLNAGVTSGGGSPDYGGELLANWATIPDTFAVRAVLFRQHDAGFLTRTYPLPGQPGQTPTGGTASVNNQGAAVTQGFSVSGLGHITSKFDATLRVIYQEVNRDGWRNAYAPLPEFTPSSYNLSQPFDFQDSAFVGWWLPSLALAYHGSGWNLVSSTSYYDIHERQIESSEASNIQAFQSFFGILPPYPHDPWNEGRTTRQGTEELRLTFDEIHRVSGVAGLYYNNSLTQGGFPPIIYPTLPQAGIGATTTNLYSYNLDERDTEAAVYGEFYVHITPRLTLTAGGRYYRVTQDSTVTADGFFNGGKTVNSGSAADTGFSPKIALAQAIGDGNVYVSAAKGFRPGGVGPPLPSICDASLAAIGLTPEAPLHFVPDSVWTYELGAKGEFADRKVYASGAAFQTNWTDVQQLIALPGCGYNFVGNTGAARVRGGELELETRPISGLRVGLAAGYQDARVTEAGTGTAFTVGERLFQIPEVTASLNATYRMPITSRVSAIFSGDYSYVGNSLSGNTTPAMPLVRPHYTLANLRIGVEGRASSLVLYLNNIGDTHANLADLQMLGFAQTTTSPTGQTIPLPRVAVLPPFQGGLEYDIRF